MKKDIQRKKEDLAKYKQKQEKLLDEIKNIRI